MTCQDCRDNLPLFALGGLEPAEHHQLEAHTASCPACQAELPAWLDAAHALAYAAPPRPLPAGLKARVMASVAASTPATIVSIERARSGSRGNFWKAACAVLGLGLLLSLLANGRQQQQIASEHLRANQLAARLAGNQERMALLGSKDVRLVTLEGMEQARGAMAKVYWSPERKAWMMAFNGLPAAGAGRTYQLWAVTSHQKMSMGTFQGGHSAELKRAEAALPRQDKPMALAVSLEPMGGMPQPTGPVVMLGKLQNL